MVATVIIQEYNGVTASATDKTSGTVRFKNADNAAANTSNPLIIPSSGQEYSYEKWLGLRITSGAPSDVINNLQFYTDGANGMGSGVSVFANSSTTFRTPAIPDESNATPLGGSASETMVDAFSYSSGATLALGSGNYSGSATNIGNYAVLVAKVTSAASPGATSAETITFQYDEI